MIDASGNWSIDLTGTTWPMALTLSAPRSLTWRATANRHPGRGD
ncbi:hypothetical protein [Shewanella baltica]|nr:hypothetical protein [Shewanella baltica]